MTRERTGKPAPRETTEEQPQEESKGLTPVREEAQSSADEAIDSIDKALAENEVRKEEMDSLIDEIDEVLEENAEEFVKNYVQRGGE